jgi:hypothetical protein
MSVGLSTLGGPLDVVHDPMYLPDVVLLDQLGGIHRECLGQSPLGAHDA